MVDKPGGRAWLDLVEAEGIKLKEGPICAGSLGSGQRLVGLGPNLAVEMAYLASTQAREDMQFCLLVLWSPFTYSQMSSLGIAGLLRVTRVRW